MHYAAGRETALHGVDAVYGIRGFASELVRGAADGGVADTKFFESSTRQANT